MLIVGPPNGRIAPQIPLLAGAGAPSRRSSAKGQVDEDEAPQPHGSKLDINVWLPPKQKDLPKVQSKAASERPTEGIITICRPNHKSRFIQPIAKVVSRTIPTTKFGNGGSIGDVGGNAVGDSAQQVSSQGGQSRR